MSKQQTKLPNDDAGGAAKSLILLPDAILVNGGADGLRSHTQAALSNCKGLEEGTHVARLARSTGYDNPLDTIRFLPYAQYSEGASSRD